MTRDAVVQRALLCGVAALAGCGAGAPGASSSPSAAAASAPAAPATAPAAPSLPPTLAGRVAHGDGTPSPGAWIQAMDLGTGTRTIVATDRDGRFQLAVPAGDYAIAVSDALGFAKLDKQAVPTLDLQLALSSDCRALTGTASRAGRATRLAAERWSNAFGDTFRASVGADGSFAMCLPAAYYSTVLEGDTLSTSAIIDVTAPANIAIEGFPREVVAVPPQTGAVTAAGLASLVDDIAASRATVVGMGEATHGTAEFASARGELTMALVRSADARLVLSEADAIAGTAIDAFVTGGDTDLAKAVAGLGFWVTDTYEFLAFLTALRDYNRTAVDKVHVWGVDVQDTAAPVDVLLRASGIAISADDRATLELAAKNRGKQVPSLPESQRASLAALLAGLAQPRGADRKSVLVAVAARSLAIQLEYWNGDMRGQYRRRRDAGMAKIAAFLVAQLGVRRACLWAHDGHLTKEPSLRMLGGNLAADPSVRYYSVGFYVFEGSTRAWDPVLKIGVIPHPIPAAEPHMLEGAVMRATGMPAVAWLPLHSAPAALRSWLATPRLMREAGAIYTDANDLLTLRRTREAYDAVVVIRTGHDSSPTPTGIRKAAHD